MFLQIENCSDLSLDFVNLKNVAFLIVKSMTLVIHIILLNVREVSKNNYRNQNTGREEFEKSHREVAKFQHVHRDERKLTEFQ